MLFRRGEQALERFASDGTQDTSRWAAYTLSRARSARGIRICATT
jgi:hypothetical protein